MTSDFPATKDILQAARLAEALRAEGMRAELPPPDERSQAVPVTVRTGPDARYPTITVWVDHNGYTWGPSREYNAPADTPIAEVTRRIVATIRLGNQAS
jgi:hypothetical protein